MLYLKNITKIKDGNGYPFVPVINNMTTLNFSSPVTILAGENGSGKSTLLKILATEMDCVFNDTDNKLEMLSGYFRLSKIKPSTTLHFSAESFIRYINKFDRIKAETIEDIIKIKNDPNLSDEARGFALMPYYRTLNEMENQYNGVLSKQSHGEGFCDFFFSRLKEGGLYFIDEPEAALSYCNQYALAYRINLFAKEHNCQFFICTHSPVMCAIPCAEIFEVNGDSINKTTYLELENIRFLERFLKNKENMFK